jgi:hypothetical protein
MAKKISKKTKLEIELIPSTCHYSNVRTTLKAKLWDKIRFIVYEKANNICEICGETGLEQGYKHRVECHEIWKYDDERLIQKLVGLIALCPTCHQAKHIGRAFAIGKQDVVIEKLMTVNKWTPEKTSQIITEAFEVNKERSKHNWKMDISLLTKPPFNLDIQPKPKRKVKKKPYKKKAKKKAKPNSRPKKKL